MFFGSGYVCDKLKGCNSKGSGWLTELTENEKKHKATCGSAHLLGSSQLAAVASNCTAKACVVNGYSDISKSFTDKLVDTGPNSVFTKMQVKADKTTPGAITKSPSWREFDLKIKDYQKQQGSDGMSITLFSGEKSYYSNSCLINVNVSFQACPENPSTAKSEDCNKCKHGLGLTSITSEMHKDSTDIGGKGRCSNWFFLADGVFRAVINIVRAEELASRISACN